MATETNSNLVLVGDFNFPQPQFDWEPHDNVVIPVYNGDLQSQQHLAFSSLLKLVNKHNLSQVVAMTDPFLSGLSEVRPCGISTVVGDE